MSASRAIAIFGATGDLARRMLFPSLYFLEQEGLLPKDVVITGCSRSAMTDAEFAARVEDWVRERAGEYFCNEAFERLRARLHHAAVDANDAASFACLKTTVGGG